MTEKIHSENDVKNMIAYYARLIGATENYLPTYGYRVGDGTPFIYVRKNDYHYGCSERALEFDTCITTDINELMYVVFSHITFSMGCAYWRKTKDTSVDQRRYFFKEQLMLLKKINKGFEERCRKELEEIIKQHPFNDNCPQSLDYL